MCYLYRVCSRIVTYSSFHLISSKLFKAVETTFSEGKATCFVHWVITCCEYLMIIWLGNVCVYNKLDCYYLLIALYNCILSPLHAFRILAHITVKRLCT